MKKLISLALVLVLTISLIACGGNSDPPSNNPGNTSNPSTPPASSPSSDPGNSQTETPSSNNSGPEMDWPNTWPGEVPELDGTVYLVSDDGIDTPAGISVFIYVESADVVTAYIDKLESEGIKKTGGTGDFDIGVVAWTFESDDYVMHINYKEKDQKCTVDISTSDEYRISQ